MPSAPGVSLAVTLPEIGPYVPATTAPASSRAVGVSSAMAMTSEVLAVSPSLSVTTTLKVSLSGSASVLSASV